MQNHKTLTAEMVEALKEEAGELLSLHWKKEGGLSADGPQGPRAFLQNLYNKWLYPCGSRNGNVKNGGGSKQEGAG